MSDRSCFALKYLLIGATILCFCLTSLQLLAQRLPFNGKVTDNSGKPLVGATIEEKGTTNSTVTKEDGSFTINVANQKAILVVSCAIRSLS